MSQLLDMPLTPTMLTLISEIDAFKGAWQAQSGLDPVKLSDMKHVATIESVASSTRIEGVKLSDAEVEALLGRLSTRSFTTRDEQEVAGYAEAMELIYESWPEIRLSENHIKQLHKCLLQFSHKDHAHRGEYKKLSNNVEAFGPDGKSLGVVFATATPFNTPRMMQALVEETNEAFADKILHPLIIIAGFVVRFLAIHPFQDGNGRLSRVLTTLLLLRCDYQYIPYSSLESIIEQNKQQYYLALRRTQATLSAETTQWQSWVEFFLRCLHKQIKHLEQKLDTLQADNNNDALNPLASHILQLLQAKPKLKISEFERLLQKPRSTIKLCLKTLVEAGHIQRHGQGKGTWYSLND